MASVGSRVSLKEYLEETIVKVEETVDLEQKKPKTKEIIENAKEILNDQSLLNRKVFVQS